MKLISRMFMAASALAVAGCTTLPGANLGGTFSAESYLGQEISGGDYNASLAREYQALAARSATKDVNWLDATAYIAKSETAAAGGVAPWSPDELGVSADGFGELQSALATHKAARPAACAKAQAYWDQYLESLHEGAYACIAAEDAKAMYDDALAACVGTSGDYIVYFGFDSSRLSTVAKAVVDDVVEALKGYASPLVSIVGHTDTSGSVAYNQALSERRATAVAKQLSSRSSAEGVSIGSITTAGRSELETAVDTGDGVREPRNRRATIAISQ